MVRGGSVLQSPSRRDIWNVLVRTLGQHLSPAQVRTWLAPVEPREAENGVLRLAVPNQFHGDWLDKRYGGLLREHFERITGEEARLHLEVDPSLCEPRDEAPAPAPAPRRRARPVRVPARRRNPFPLNPRHRIDRWVEGPSNEVASAAIRAVLEDRHEFRTLLIHGECGMGKSHLAQALVHELEEDEDRRVLYATGEQFLNLYVAAAERRELTEFRQRFRGVDVLVIDDVQALAGKEKTQHEFGVTIQQLHDEGAWVVVTADRPAHQIEGLTDRLRSWLGQGLSCPLAPLTPAMRRRLIDQLATEEGVDFPTAVSEWIAQQVRGNVRELMGAATCVIGHAALRGMPVSLELARSVLHELAPPRTHRVDFDTIADVVSTHYGVKVGDLQGRRRTRQVVLPRQVSMALMRKLTGSSLEAIGRFFGGRDHSTVLYSIEQVDRRVRRSPDEQAHLDALTEEILRRG